MSAVVPPPPSGSILQKQSSFSRSKAGTTTAAAASASANKAPTNSPSANTAPPAPKPNSVPKQPAGPPAPPPGMWGPNSQLAPGAAANGQGVAHPPGAVSPASGTKRAAPMPAAQQQPLMGPVPTPSPASGAKRAVPAAVTGPATGPNGVVATPKPTPAAAGGARRPSGGVQPQATNGATGAGVPPAGTPSSMARKNSMNGGVGSGYGSMGPGGPMGAYGSMGGGGSLGNGYGSMGPGGPMGGFGSMGPGSANMGSMYGQNPNQSSMYGPNNQQGSMIGPMGGSMYGQNVAGSSAMGPMTGSLYGQIPSAAGDDAGAAGSLYGQNPGTGSVMGSMYGMGGPFCSMGPGSMMGGGSMMGPMGSMYGMGGPMMGSMYGGGGMSTYGIAAQWGSLANMSTAGRGGAANRSSISSEYGGFASEAAAVDLDDLCPNIGTFEDAKDLKRSGKRGGNHLYSRDKHEKIVATNNSNVQALTIKRKSGLKTASPGAGGASSSASPTDTSTRAIPRASSAAGAAGSSSNAATGGNGKARAKVPSNYNVHSLIIVDKAGKTTVTSVKDPATVVYEKAGKKETFEVDEAIERASAKEEVDSVLLSELRSNWFNGHNSSLMMCAGKGKVAATQEVARNFIQKCIERLAKNEKDTGVRFDITMSMVAIRGADQCCDLLKNGASYDKMAMGSSPVYGPCLLDLETKVIKTGAEATEHFNAGLKNAKEEKEIVTAFYVLKTIKKTGAETEVHLSSMCLALCGETVSHMTDIKDKSPSSPHRLFRYAVDGACVTVSGLCIDSNDEDARAALEVERKMREVKNQPPRSGNVKRFVDFTYKEITRQKEKVATATGSEKKTRETQIERMEEMVKDANELLAEPEKTRPKGYSTGR